MSYHSVQNCPTLVTPLYQWFGNMGNCGAILDTSHNIYNIMPAIVICYIRKLHIIHDALLSRTTVMWKYNLKLYRAILRPWGNFGHHIHNLWGKCGHIERIIISIAYFVDMMFITILLISDAKFWLWGNFKFRDFGGVILDNAPLLSLYCYMRTLLICICK